MKSLYRELVKTSKLLRDPMISERIPKVAAFVARRHGFSNTDATLKFLALLIHNIKRVHRFPADMVCII